MSKPIKIILGLIGCLLFALLIIKITAPSEEEKERHLGILCDVIRSPKIAQTSEDLFDGVQFYQQQSIPSYVVNKPKFQEQYTKKIVARYLALSKQQQQQAQSDYTKCDQLIQK